MPSRELLVDHHTLPSSHVTPPHRHVIDEPAFARPGVSGGREARKEPSFKRSKVSEIKHMLGECSLAALGDEHS